MACMSVLLLDVICVPSCTASCVVLRPINRISFGTGTTVNTAAALLRLLCFPNLNEHTDATCATRKFAHLRFPPLLLSIDTAARPPTVTAGQAYRSRPSSSSRVLKNRSGAFAQMSHWTRHRFSHTRTVRTSTTYINTV